VSDVKRYVAHCTGLLSVPPESRATYNENWKDVVLASDYAAVAAEVKRLHDDLSALRSTQIDGGMEAELWHQLRMMMDRALGETVDQYVRADSYKALAALLADRDRLRAALERFGQHTDDCEWEHYDTDAKPPVMDHCSCGLAEALRGADQPAEQPTEADVRSDQWAGFNRER
jgi:hypothetical protein